MGCIDDPEASAKEPPYKEPPYIGRFAPSPTGELHFGSLLAALASYLDARHHRGQWLVRMEDLDPSREPPGAASAILSTLEAFGLHWDGTVLYQSSRLEAYRDALDTLRNRQLIYSCTCSRQTIRAIGGVYDGRCRLKASAASGTSALRVKVDDLAIAFSDLIQGPQRQDLLTEAGDFVLFRKDGLFAYQLAVVVDDGFQQISHIVRGSDLLDSTPRQIWLQQRLGLPEPLYAHIPVAVNTLGQKLSKQHFAEPLDKSHAASTLHQALAFLGQNPPLSLRHAPVSEQLQAALESWDIQAVPKLANIPL